MLKASSDYLRSANWRSVITFNTIHFQIQDFQSVVRMLVHICLVVGAFLASAADAAKCVFPDQYEITFKHLKQNIFYNLSIDGKVRMQAERRYELDSHNQPKLLQRNVRDYNMMTRVSIPDTGECVWSKLKYEESRQIPDNAVKVDQFPVKLPDTIPKKIQFWRFRGAKANKDLILGVEYIKRNVCLVVVEGFYKNNQKFDKTSVAFIKGDYTLSIRDTSVFHLPAKCLPRNNRTLEDDII